MGRSWTFGQKLALGFAAVVALTLLIGAVSVFGLRSVINDWEEVVSVYARNAADARRLEVLSLRRTAANRAFLLTRDEQFRQQVDKERQESDDLLRQIEAHVISPEARAATADINKYSQAQAQAADAVMAARAKSDVPLEAITKQFQDQVIPQNQAFQTAVDDFVKLEEGKLKNQGETAADSANLVTGIVIAIAVAGVIVAAVIAFALSRLLSRQIGSAVQHIQSSSSELQAAANQQTAGAKEQVASMNEISTTIRELLTTAKQIAESAQRVAQIAGDSAGAARTGDEMVAKAKSDVAGIRQQVDLIVNHMLDLGRKSQQIGGILEIINELAEQTNILAINATIEAAGAGEAGKRFSVVADEIRKLADRVGGSTKEIRALIDEVRSAVNTTVMATETGSKTVDIGVRQFGEVTSTFRHIAELLMTTTQAAREIELSTKQQSTAVEQVNTAVTSVAQASRESEASSSQVLQTVSELTTLSRDLARLVRPAGMNGQA